VKRAIYEEKPSPDHQHDTEKPHQPEQDSHTMMLDPSRSDLTGINPSRGYGRVALGVR